MPSLIVTSGILSGQVFSFCETVVIGRGQYSDVRLNDPTVSRRHAEIRARDSRFELRDLLSANGTCHKGRRIAKVVAITDGDELQFGEIKVVFRSQGVESPSLVMPAVAGARETRSQPGIAVMQDATVKKAIEPDAMGQMAARLKLFCDIAQLANARQPLRAQVLQAMDAVLRVFPDVTIGAIYASVAGGGTLSLLCACSRPGWSLNAKRAEAVLGEAVRQEMGLHVNDETALEVLATRVGLQEMPARALLALPLRLSGELLGMVYLEADSEAAWHAADHELFRGIAAQFAWLIGAHRMSSPERAIEAYDLQLARRIQQRFLPQAPPQLAGYRFADSYAAARVIGGDYYDFVNFSDGRVGILIADVSGKALSGALYMARLGVQVRALTDKVAGPKELNYRLHSQLEAGMFITMLAAGLRPESGALELVSAGHPYPLWRRVGGSVQAIAAGSALPLGAAADSNYSCAPLQLEPGELLLFYTDGLDEAHNEQKELFGRERVMTVLAKSADSQLVLDNLLAEVGQFAGGEPQSDDLTMIALMRSEKVNQ